MASILRKIGNADNVAVNYYEVDTERDMWKIDVSNAQRCAVLMGITLEDANAWSNSAYLDAPPINYIVREVLFCCAASCDNVSMCFSRSDGANSRGIVEKFVDGLWIGNGIAIDASGYFSSQDGCNGIFVKFTDGKTYVVNGSNMMNVYTGDAIARFG